MAIRIFMDGIEYIPGTESEAKAVAVDMWYDRHLRHWEIFAIDAEGNQVSETRYGFGKKEATRIRREIAAEYNI